MKPAFRALLGGALLLLALPAGAHHSFAMFDTAKPLTLSGTVKAFEWTNPHCFIQLLVPGQGAAKATAAEWSIEMGAPVHLVRSGWKSATLKKGDRITVIIYPLKDGKMGGNFVSGTRADGKPIGSAP